MYDIVYMYVCMYEMDIGLYDYEMYVCMCVSMYVCLYECTCLNVFTCMCNTVYMYARAYVCMISCMYNFYCIVLIHFYRSSLSMSLS